MIELIIYIAGLGLRNAEGFQMQTNIMMVHTAMTYLWLKGCKNVSYSRAWTPWFCGAAGQHAKLEPQGLSSEISACIEQNIHPGFFMAWSSFSCGTTGSRNVR